MARDRSIWNLVLVITVVVGWCGYSLVGRLAGSKTRPPSASVDYWVKRFRATYGVEVVYRSSVRSANPIDFDLAPTRDDARLGHYLTVIYFELGRYSKSYRERLGLARIAVYRHLRYQGQKRDAIPMPGMGTLYLDYDADYDEPDLESHQFHHELFHYMMYVTHGYGWDDPDWDACNPPGFQYGNGGINDRDPTSGILNHPQLGFVDHYATSAISEDMAEMDACRYVRRQAALLREWRKTDPYLNRKYKRLLEILEPYQ